MLEAIAYCETNPPEIASDWAAEGAFIADLLHPEDYAGQPHAVKAITQRFTRALESLVRNTSGCTAAGNTSHPNPAARPREKLETKFRRL